MAKTTIITCTQLPTYRLGYLEEAWRSLQAQTQQDFRWFVVLDAPQNPAPEFLNDPRITVLSSIDHIGQAAARNRALERVTTPYLCTLDDDDVLPAPSIGTRERALDDDRRLGWIGGHMADRAPNGNVAGRWEQPARAGAYPPGRLLDEWGAPERYFVALTHTFTMRTLLVRDLGGWQPDGSIEDIGLVARMSERHRGLIVDDVFYQWRKHSRQATNSLDAEVERVAMSRHVWQKARALGRRDAA
jgi:glycosyltransferase involved in cell wall biosynthesis